MTLRERQHVAAAYLRLRASRTACTTCLRYSVKRVGEREARRPLDWYPIDGSARRLKRLVRGGASIGAIAAYLELCLPYCAPCSKKGVGVRG